ncbi:hypothetical protein KY360_03870 [Candidatus Woesearchaeota archaeon]|nr:hypothetical protein [Candidatus Woesearchaeota archaeon]
MVKIKQIILISSLLIFLLPLAEAIGLLSPEIGTITYRPNYEAEYTFFAVNYNYDFEAYVSGSLAKYITVGPLIDYSPSMKQFNLKIKFPDSVEFEPGVYIHHVGVREVGHPGGMVGALTAVQTKLRIEVFSKEKVIRANFDAPDANENEIMNFRVEVQSASYQDIALVMARITVYDMENNTLATFDTDKATLRSGEARTLDAKWDNSILVPGNYRAEALVIFDGKSILLEDLFKIGTLMVKINKYTDEFISGQIDEFSAEVENVWNNHISDIYIELFIDGEKVLKTATTSLNPWQKGIINGYWNVTFAPGEYNGKIRLYYGDTYSEKNIKVKIKEPMIRLSLENIYSIAIVGLLIIVIILGVILTRLYSKQREMVGKKESKKQKINKSKKIR